MKRKILLFIVVLHACAAALLAAENLEELFAAMPTESRELLEREGAVQHYWTRGDDIVLLPNHALSRHIEKALKDARLNVVSERIISIRASVSPQGVTDLYNSLRRISDLSHLRFFNARTEIVSNLFYESRAIESPEKRRVVPDPLVETIPADDIVWVLQQMPPLGEVASEYRYRSEDGAFLLLGSNYDPMLYRGVRVVAPGGAITALLVVPTEDHIVVYSVGGVRAFMFFGLFRERMEAAFAGRARGILTWYYETYLRPLE